MARKKRADGRVQVQVDIGVEDGKRKRKYFYGDTLKEARAARDEWLAEQERRAKVTVADADVTMRVWGKMWLDSVAGTSQHTTHYGKVTAIRQQNKFTFYADDVPVALGDLRVCDVRPIHVQAYMRSLDNKSRSTIAQRRYVLKSMLNAAVHNGIIDKSPWQDVRCPRGTYEGHDALPEEMQQQIADTWSKHRVGIWALLMLYTGMRREELAALDVADVNLKDKTIYVHSAAVLKEGGRIKPTKTTAGTRTIPILPQLEGPLAEAIGGRTTGRICLSAAGEPLMESSFKRAWDSYMLVLERKQNGLEPCEDTHGYRREAVRKKFAQEGKAYKELQRFTPHDLRYTYATILYDAGVDVKTAAALLGHDDIQVTMGIYTQLSRKKQQQGVNALLKYMRKKKK